MTGVLDGRIALVTGAARGLGRTIVDHYARAGARGIGFDLRPPAMNFPAGWTAVAGNVCRESDLESAFATCIEQYGRLDIVVANAGVVPPWRETEFLDLEEWRRVFDINVLGVTATIKHAVPWLRKSGGSIVVMGSLNSQRAHPQQCLYTATKHAVLGIVRATAQDLGRYGIRVNALGPGPVATEALVERVTARAAEGQPSMKSKSLMKRQGIYLQYEQRVHLFMSCS